MGEPNTNVAARVAVARHGQRGQEWVQVPRASMEAMALLMGESPAAANLLMRITSRMGDNNAFISSNQALAEMAGVSTATVKRSLKLLQERHWINILRLGPTGTVRVIVVNDQVAWFGPREGLRHSLFSASVLLSEAEQDALELAANGPMIEIPAIYRGERQLPSGDGLPPPSQPALPGMEPDLPAIRRSEK